MPDEVQANPTPEPSKLPPAAILAALLKLVEDVSAKVDAPRECWTREETAAALGMSLSAFGSLESSGGIGPMPLRFGTSDRFVRYRVQSIKDWVAAGAPHRTKWLAMEEATKRRRAG